MDRKKLISEFIRFFEEKGHALVPNASLIPENDPTVLFTTAGMHPLVPFLLGEKHPKGKRLVSVQRCIRTGDIEDVGDEVHHTFFEMLGNWSLGDYFKEEAIKMSFEFLMKVLGIPMEKLAVSVFAGNEKVARDEESAEIWKSLGISEKRIAFLSEKHNWWGPAGETGPCGPDTEMFYWASKEPAPESFDPEDKRWVEIWNDVLMGYVKTKEGEFVEAKQKNIDTGMGVERTVAVLNGLEDNYLADMWLPIIKKIEEVSGKSYEENKREMRIVADHLKAAVFIIADGVVPGKVEQGYVLRRLIRRAVRYLRKLGVPIESERFSPKIAEAVFEIYDDYEILKGKKEKILEELAKEEEKFQRTLERGLKEFERMASGEKISGKDAFLLYQSYGFPLEMTMELAKEKGIDVDVEGFREEEKRHQELSRTASAGRFKSGLADDSEATKRLHTATHLLNAALKVVLKNPDIHQRGSNITPERLRFDFNFDRKLTDEEKKQIEEWINDKIEKDLPVRMEEMSLEEAKKIGAEGVFEGKYGEKVKVYFIGEPGKEVSIEICAGPHVSHLGELGKFKIKKEESSSAGVRRIKAVLERG